MCNCTDPNFNNPEPLSLSRMAKSVANGFKDTIKQDFVSPQVEANRLAQCLTCPHRGNVIFGRKEDKILKTDVCMLCMCRLKGWIGVLPPKAKLKNSVCDSGRWQE